jgi:preprotein translocase subunit SecG
MSFIVGILTFLLIVNCALLILLVLIQLPKKDAGVGLAFGGGAADALFGAGSGNALTKITKYATVVFVLLALFLGHLQAGLRHAGSGSAFEKAVQQKQIQAPASAPQRASQPAVAPTNNLLSVPLAPVPNAPAK